jgi:hypothetical protein
VFQGSARVILLLGLCNTGARNKSDSRKRKTSVMEGQFHRVTPLAARWPPCEKEP